MRTPSTPVWLPSHAAIDVERGVSSDSSDICSRTRPGIRWRTTNCIRSENGGRVASPRDGGLRMHFDEVIQSEQTKRQPHGRGRLDADFEESVRSQPKRNQDLEIDSVVGRPFY